MFCENQQQLQGASALRKTKIYEMLICCNREYVFTKERKAEYKDTKGVIRIRKKHWG